ncbi:hypothetical protein [Paraclostridium sordellii]|uniref:hypothetical protein n=1 Tax=Paraclostridium sordellii TaxID=1505 RepID=UPI000C7666AB|nr:hypothetical protein [Paeniclostridium sordellii]AUN15254.1 hypothetical protein RSJ16_13900 [Paeniclostridium sordellii]
MKAVTILVTIWTTITSIYNFFFKRNSTIYIINLLFNLFYGLPIILDEIIGKPIYLPTFPGFDIAINDELTQITYLIIVNLIQIVFYIYKTKINDFVKINDKNIIPNKFQRIILLILIVLPIIYIFFAPEISVYKEYGYFLKNIGHGEIMKFHSLMWNLTFLSIVSIAIFIHSFNNKQNVIKITLLLLPILGFDIWVNGKRNIAILTICIIIYIYNDKKLFSKKSILILSLFLLMSGLIFNNLYQNNIRDFTTKTFKQSYSNFRIDYGRDDVMKLAIYSNYNPEVISILDYKGQSLLYYPLFFIPRAMWPDKPQPYHVYVVNNAIGYKGNNYIGWGMTVSIFTELISNLGTFIGPLLGAIIICYLVKLSDSSSSTLERFVSFYLAFTLIYNGARLEILIIFIILNVIKFIKFNIIRGRLIKL